MNSIDGAKILITGGAGFIGSHIADQLLDLNVSEIILIDDLVRGSYRNIANSLASGKVKLVEGDIMNTDLLNELVASVDYCFHMAALRINQCVAEPRRALEVMFDGTFNVAEACVKYDIKKVVVASSASIYGTADTFPTSENHHPYNNHTLYGVAKVANEGMFRSFHDMYGLDYNAMRYFNVYGPRMDTHGKYTEVLIRWHKLIKNNEPPLIYGDGKQTMDFVYVEDVARASVEALINDTSDEVFNVASGTETSLEQLCLSLIKAMGSNLKPQYVPMPEERKKVEVSRRLADVTKAQDLLGFKASVSLDQGLVKLVQWLDTLE